MSIFNVEILKKLCKGMLKMSNGKRKKKYKANKLLRCMVCSHMFEVTEDNTYCSEDGIEIYYCTNCGTDKVK